MKPFLHRNTLVLLRECITSSGINPSLNVLVQRAHAREPEKICNTSESQLISNPHPPYSYSYYWVHQKSPLHLLSVILEIILLFFLLLLLIRTQLSLAILCIDITILPVIVVFVILWRKLPSNM